MRTALIRSRRLPMLGAVFVLYLLVEHALTLGQSNAWDLRNYHLYLPWAWVTGRLDVDVTAAQAQTFFNPLMHVPLLWSAMQLGPVVHTTLLALLQGANLFLLYAIALRVLAAPFPRGLRWFALLAAVMGTTGATALSELGTSYGENLVSLPMLGGMLVLLAAAARARPRPDQAPPLAPYAVAGVLIGLATGLKLAIAPFAAAAVACAPLLVDSSRARLRVVAGLLAGSAIGFALTAGPWMLELWGRYRNPLYPAFSDWFPTIDYPAVDLRDSYRPPRTVLEWVAYPLVWTDHATRAGELKFRDHRILFWYLLVAFLPWWRRRDLPRPRDHRSGVFLSVWLGSGYVLSMALFGYYRFLVLLEMLAPVATAWLVGWVWPRGSWRIPAVAALFAVAAATQITPNLGHVPFDGPFLQVEAPPMPKRAHVVLAGDKPTAFLALAFGAEHDYIRVGGNHAGSKRAPWAVDDRVAAALDRDAEPVVVVVQEPLADVRADLARFGLDADDAACAPVTVNLLSDFDVPIRACTGTRVRPAAAALAEARVIWGRRCALIGPSDTWAIRQCKALAASGTAIVNPASRTP